MAEVELQGLRKVFGKVDVIHGVDCRIADGEFLVIVGPSGCGKSTLLRMVAGLETVTAGEIRIGERVVNRLEPAQRDIAMVFQNYALYPHMSVYRNMAYGLKIRGLGKTEIDARVRRAAEILELGELLERRPRQLSGGQRQRVAMGRAIVREPAVFLFDEPLSNLDAKLRVQMRVEIKKLQERLGITSIYVTHDQVEAMTLADRLIVMNAGVAEQIDTPLAVFSHPASRFVAGFIGSPAMNFLPARISADGARVEIEGGESLPLNGGGAEAGRPVTLGIRPEHFDVAGTDEALLTLEVNHVEILGADTLVYGRLQGAQTELTLRLPDVHHFDPATRLGLSVATHRMHLFDPRSGRRMAA